MTNIEALLDEPESLPEAEVSLCLRGGLQRRFEELDAHLREARQADVGKLNHSPETRRLAEEIEQVRQQMTEATVVFKLRAMTRPAWRKLLRQHPPRKDDVGVVLDSDSMGFDADAFPAPLIRACAYEPKLTGEQWVKLLDERLTPHQFDQLFSAAYRLNRGEVSVPFSLAASRILRNSQPE